jgi:hypothetical protein
MNLETNVRWNLAVRHTRTDAKRDGQGIDRQRAYEMCSMYDRIWRHLHGPPPTGSIAKNVDMSDCKQAASAAASDLNTAAVKTNDGKLILLVQKHELCTIQHKSQSLHWQCHEGGNLDSDWRRNGTNWCVDCCSTASRLWLSQLWKMN